MRQYRGMYAEIVDVQHRVTKPCRDYRITEVVHVGKISHMQVIIDSGPGLTKFRQAGRPQCRKQKNAATTQHARHFSQTAGHVVNERQKHVGEDQVNTGVRQRQPQCVGLHLPNS